MSKSTQLFQPTLNRLVWPETPRGRDWLLKSHESQTAESMTFGGRGWRLATAGSEPWRLPGFSSWEEKKKKDLAAKL